MRSTGLSLARVVSRLNTEGVEQQHRPLLAAVGEPTEAPRSSPKRGPPYWKSRVLRRLALGDEHTSQGAEETA